MSRIALFFFLLLSIVLTEEAFAQPPVGVMGGPPGIERGDSVAVDEVPIELILPWKLQQGTAFKTTREDSLLRWEIWPNWGEYNAYRHDAISFRQGTTGRIDAFDISGYSPYEQKITVDGIDISDPLTGLVNYNFVPANKVGEASERMIGSYQSNISLKDYYLTKPISYLNFDEASYSFRNLEFMVAQNIKERTNIEVSFWDRRDGGNFLSNDVEGNQILLRGYHYLNQNLQLRGAYLRNEFNRDEPFGYIITDVTTFGFGEFSTSPSVSGASSNTMRRDFILGLYQRADSTSPEQMGISLNQTRNEFSLPSTVDTLSWEISSYTLNAFRWFSGANWRAKLDGNAQYNNVNESSNFSTDNWTSVTLNPELEYKISPTTNLSLVGKYGVRSTDHQEFEAAIGSSFRLSQGLRFQINASMYSSMPSIQQLNWSSANYIGNEDLKNKQGISMFGEMEARVSERMTFGVSGRYSLVSNDFSLSNDSVFVNGDEYSTLSGTLYGKYETRRVELESSVTASGFTFSTASTIDEAANRPDEKFWIRNNAFIKGYLFSRATYAKAGVKTVFSPLPYYSRLFNTELQYWEAAAVDESQIPAFFRMDLEISARVRGMMILIRWENLLDGYGQAGYFESTRLPMPGRRLIVGIRAQFRN